ncbi:MAG: hypothetical protein CLLPBCKN_004572 [Chroococcidiopsis cubana SAG 39.79]|nr:hypothetical protein [Chroococcidiopsis cubana SAG 39.79]
MSLVTRHLSLDLLHESKIMDVILLAKPSEGYATQCSEESPRCFASRVDDNSSIHAGGLLVEQMTSDE